MSGASGGLGARPAAAPGRLLRRALPFAAVAVAPAVVAALPGYDVVRERAFDAMLAWTAPRAVPADTPHVLVVDIDAASLARQGGWPWRREQLARLVADIAAARPRAIGLDILLADADRRSPAALARALAAATGDASRAAGADTLVDGDRELAAALAKAPAVLGSALGGDPAPAPDGRATAAAPPRAPILISGKPRLPGLWTAPSEIAPVEPLARAAAGVGVLALLADGDGRIRRVPLLAAAGSRLLPGLAVETARVAADASVLLLSPDGLAVGDRRLPTGADAMLRLRPVAAAMHARRTLSAAALLADPTGAAPSLAGRVVLVGSSAPEAGGLRVAAGGGLVSSVALQADAVTQILAGDAPRRPARLAILEVVLAGLAALAAAVAGWRLPPRPAAVVGSGLALGWAGVALAASSLGALLVDPLLVPLAAVADYAAAALAAAARTWAREARLRTRFAQHVAPEVVARLAADPMLARLDGDLRTVTVLISDIEGFTGLVERSEPRRLVALLDRYVDGMSAIVVAHGGMVNKIVGDSLIALFNAPLDLAGHERRAVACAEAMRAFAAGLAAEPDVAASGLGRTRIGIETGRLIVGDVGRGAKIDYTGYGDAINTAARLEAANKELGSSICIGETTASAFAPGELRPTGRLMPRGRSQTIAVFEPWPPGWSTADRAAYVTAYAERATAPDRWRACLVGLAARHRDDALLARLVAELDAVPTA